MSFVRQLVQPMRLSTRSLHSSPATRAPAASTAKQSAKPKTMWQVWYAVEAVPIYVTVGVACVGAGWYLSRLARHPDVVWDRHNNPEPWNRVEQGTNTKLWAVNQKFDKQYKRDAL